MDKSVFLYWWLSFDLQYYLILGGTNNVLHIPFMCILWSQTLAKRSCNNNGDNEDFHVAMKIFFRGVLGMWTECNFLMIWSHLFVKSSNKNFIFCAVCDWCSSDNAVGGLLQKNCSVNVVKILEIKSFAISKGVSMQRHT